MFVFVKGVNEKNGIVENLGVRGADEGRGRMETNGWTRGLMGMDKDKWVDVDKNCGEVFCRRDLCWRQGGGLGWIGGKGRNGGIGGKGGYGGIGGKG